MKLQMELSEEMSQWKKHLPCVWQPKFKPKFQERGQVFSKVTNRNSETHKFCVQRHSLSRIGVENNSKRHQASQNSWKFVCISLISPSQSVFHLSCHSKNISSRTLLNHLQVLSLSDVISKVILENSGFWQTSDKLLPFVIKSQTLFKGSEYFSVSLDLL